MMQLGANSVSGPRPYNEDTSLTKDFGKLESHLSGLRAFIMVSDGMGGHQSGDVASRLARETAESYIDDWYRAASNDALNIEPALALGEIVHEAHAAITAAAQASGSSMGATFVGAFIGKDRAWIGHVGDSRAYLLRGGEARQLTVDHSQVGRLIAEGVLTEEQAQSHPSRNVIERALGFAGAEAEVDIVDLDIGDALVLCSDGLSTVLSADDIAAICASSKDAQKAAENLTLEAVAAETDDNTTAVVWSEDWGAFRANSPKEMLRRKEKSAARRAGSRHSNAQRSTYIFAGIIGVIALALIGVALVPTGGGGGGAASGPGSKPVSQTAGSSGGSASSAVPDPVAGGVGADSLAPTNDQRPTIHYEVKNSETLLRSSANVDKTHPNVVAKIPIGATFDARLAVVPTSDGDFYKLVPSKDLGAKQLVPYGHMKLSQINMNAAFYVLADNFTTSTVRGQ